MKSVWIGTFAMAFSFMGCAAKYSNQTPVGQVFPTVVGKRLDGMKFHLPRDLQGKPTILIVGYKQNSQFDIDRWLLGLYDSQINIPVYEIPTVVGMVPGMFSGKIDKGMKSGIPEELWLNVVTVYNQDAKKIARFTGNEKPLNARVMLLNEKGEVTFFHDRGFSPMNLRKLTNLTQ